MVVMPLRRPHASRCRKMHPRWPGGTRRSRHATTRAERGKFQSRNAIANYSQLGYALLHANDGRHLCDNCTCSGSGDVRRHDAQTTEAWPACRRLAASATAAAQPGRGVRLDRHAADRLAGCASCSPSLGPGYLVAVGYMDPGNWATSLAGGSKFGYALLTVALLSNLMAILLQALCARLGIGAGRDLAQACRDAFPRAVSWPLWVLTEIAICATDLAEVIGTAIGAQSAVRHSARDRRADHRARRVPDPVDAEPRLPLGRGLHRHAAGRDRGLLLVQIAMADPDWGAVIRGFAPTTEIVTNPDMLYLAIGIIGATVMPHNLYLHSGDRADAPLRRQRCRQARGDQAGDRSTPPSR